MTASTCGSVGVVAADGVQNVHAVGHQLIRSHLPPFSGMTSATWSRIPQLEASTHPLTTVQTRSLFKHETRGTRRVEQPQQSLRRRRRQPMLAALILLRQHHDRGWAHLLGVLAVLDEAALDTVSNVGELDARVADDGACPACPGRVKRSNVRCSSSWLILAPSYLVPRVCVMHHSR